MRASSTDKPLSTGHSRERGARRRLRWYARDDYRIRLVQLARNYGKEAAVTAAIEHAEGDLMLMMDPDLQDPRNTFWTSWPLWALRVVRRIFFGDILLGWTTMIAVIVFLSGIQTVIIGTDRHVYRQHLRRSQGQARLPRAAAGEHRGCR